MRPPPYAKSWCTLIKWALVFGFLASFAKAQTTVYWTNGSHNSTWATGGNWSPAGTPGSSDNLVFDSTHASGSQTIALGSNRQAGTLTFAGTNSYTFNSSSQSLQVNTSGTNFTQNSSAALTFNNTFNLATDLTMNGTGAGSVAFSGVLSGSGGLTMNGSYGVTLSKANTYSGATTINSNTLTFGVTNALPTATALTIASGATVDLYWGHNATIGSLSGAGTINMRSNTLTVGDSTNTTFSGVISDGGAYGTFVKNGTGTLTLSGNNTYSGPTTINAGAIVAASGTALGSPTYANTVASGAALELSGGITLNESNVYLNGSGLSSGGALRSISGANTYSGTVTFNSASTLGADSGASLAVTGSLSLGYALSTAGSGDITLSGQIYGSSGITKNGSGTLTLSGTSSNSFSGTLQINDGTVLLSKTGSGVYAATGPVVVGDGIGSAGSAVLSFGGNNQIPTYATSLTVASDGNLNIGSTSQSLDNVTSAGIVTIGSSGTLTLGANSGTSTLGGTLTGSGTFVKSGSGTVTINGSSANSFNGALQVSNGTVSMAKSGAGNYAMSGGSVTVGTGTGTASTLSMGGDNQLAPSIGFTVMSDGTFNVGSTAQSINAVTSAGIVNVASSGNLTLGASGGSSTLGGTLTGAGTVTLSSGAATINGTTNNSFSGALQVNSGTVTLSKSGTGIYAMTGGSVTLGTGTGGPGAAVLAFGGNNQLSPSTSVTVHSDGNLNVGTTSQSINSLTSTGIVTVGSTGTLALGASGGNSTLAGTLSGTGTLAKSGTGTLTFNSTLSFSGTLTLSSGTLALTGSTLTLGTLHITGNSTIDFGGGAGSTLSVTNFIVDSGVTLNAINWIKSVDNFYASNWSGATLNVTGSTPMNQVSFNGQSGNYTIWTPFGSNDAVTSIIPEPSTYGIILSALCLAAFGLLRWRKQT